MIPKLVKQLFATYVLLAAASATACWAAQVSYFASGIVFIAVTGLTQAWVAEVFGRKQPTRLGKRTLLPTRRIAPAWQTMSGRGFAEIAAIFTMHDPFSIQVSGLFELFRVHFQSKTEAAKLT